MRLRLSLCASVIALSACAPAPGGDPIGQLEQANFVNGGFETGAFGANWTVTRAQWGNSMGTVGFLTFPPRTLADLKLTSPAGTDLSSVVGPGVPADLTAADSLRLPFFGGDAAKVNGRIGTQGNRNSNYIQQTMTVTVADVDPNDGQVHLRFAAAPLLNAPTHTPLQQPYFFVELRNTTKNVALYNTFNFSNQPGVQWKTATTSVNADPELYTDWEAFDIAPGPAGIEVGDQILATVVATGCSFTGHFGEVYVDEFGTTFPYPNVNVSAPQFVNANSDLTYTVTAKNSTVATATGVIVDFTTPPVADSNVTTAPAVVQTTFQSVSAPGATCTTPAVGASLGTVTCNIGNLAPGATYTFTVTVHVPVIPGAHVAPDFVNEGTYDIKTDQRPAPLGGGLVQTQVTASNVVGLDTTLTDNKSSVTWGSANTYTLTITNHGPTDATGVAITDVRPAQLTAATWTCVGTGSATCGAANGSGNISTTANIPVNGTVTYTINATVTGGPADGSFTYRATAAPTGGQVQSILFDNTGVDTDTASTTLLTLTVNTDGTGTGSGTIVSYPTGINCGATCASNYAHGSQIALTALPATGSVFSGWTGGCAGTTNPCTVTLNAATTVTAKFDKPILTTSLVTTSNGGSTSVRVGDTATYGVKIVIPAGATGIPVKLTDTFPSGLDFASATASTTTGVITCSPNACTAPTIVTGATSTWDYGTVSCTVAGPCEINLTITGRVATTATRGTSLVDAISATLMGSQDQTALTVIEPNLTISRTPSPATGLVRGQPETITVTVANNTGGANAPAYDTAISFPTPAGYIAGNFVNGTCPVGVVGNFAGNVASFSFPAADAGAIAAGTSCTFTYQLTGNATATGNATVTAAAGTATTKSLTGAAPPAKTYNVTPPATTFATAAIPNNQLCAMANECVSMVCFNSDTKCGYPDGSGTCDGTTGPVVCRSGRCSANGSCAPAVGCLVDGDCTTATEFCNTQTQLCTPKLDNGVAVPTITGHMPALTGTCDAAVGAVVCTSGVCDTADSVCGLADEHGPCTMANVCRSGFCSTSGTCGPAGGCLVDGDCNTASQFCNTSSKLCVPKLPNGDPVPTVSGHTPALTGVCSTDVGQVVCASLVCDVADNLCGYANGDGSCDTGTAATVCRSGACGNDGKCGLVNGEGPCDASTASKCRANACRASGTCGSPCKTDNDCSAAAPLCDATSGECSPKAPNGQPVPTILGHDPTLDGKCTATSGMIGCVSGVCDPTDNLCGLADGNTGTGIVCTPANATTVCRSGNCGDDGKCGTNRTLVLTGGGLSCTYGERTPIGNVAWLFVLAAVGALVRRRRSA